MQWKHEGAFGVLWHIKNKCFLEAWHWKLVTPSLNTASPMYEIPSATETLHEWISASAWGLSNKMANNGKSPSIGLVTSSQFVELINKGSDAE
jgi:hypothetical protein